VDFAELTRVLQTSISPVAMISGIGLLLLSMTNRLGRTTDRARLLSEAIARCSPEEGKRLLPQVRILYRRSRILRLAITLGAASILFVSVLIIALFAIITLSWDLQHLVLILFVLSLLSLVGSVVFFMHDLTLALQALRHEVGEHLL
jgi:ABC-type multidrug transport system fused ATPase/permease subunit